MLSYRGVSWVAIGSWLAHLSVAAKERGHFGSVGGDSARSHSG
jgi:hypothetical protein